MDLADLEHPAAQKDRSIAMSGTVTVEKPKCASSRLLAMAGVLFVAYLPVAAAQAQTPPQASIAATLFENVRIFDGRNATLSAPSRVLVRGNIIERISSAPIDIGGEANVQVISAGGRVLMPGLIDAHWHAFMAASLG